MSDLYEKVNDHQVAMQELDEKIIARAAHLLKSPVAKEFSHYYRPCPFDGVDIYRVLLMFGVTDPCLQHAVKKLLVAGGRTAGKSTEKDIDEAIASLTRWKEMRDEEKRSVAPE